MTAATTRTTCSYCSVGCNIEVTTLGDGSIRVAPDKNYPVNKGKVCPKGYHMISAFNADDRGTVPLLRGAEGRMEPVSWERAYQVFTSKFKGIINNYGRDAAAFISTGQLPTEEMAMLGAVAKFGMGLYHGDGNTRQCMATTAVAYKQSFGFDAPPFAYEDFEVSDYMVFVGGNPVITHPVMWQRVQNNTRNPKIVVVDPRFSETARAPETSEHVALAPKSDLHFFYAVAKVLIENDWIDRGFIERSVEGFDDLKAHLEGLKLSDLLEAAGLEEAVVRRMAQDVHRAKAASFYWTMGVNQGHQAVRIAQSIINICLITGNIGRPGTGPNSLTGQANAMGSRLFSNTTALYGGYAYTDESDRKKMAEILDIPLERIPDKNSLPYNVIIDKVNAGEIKGLWVICTNPIHSWINKKEFFAARNKLDFLVVQDLYHSTETAQQADLFLPAAASAEKSGVFINSERRIGVVQKVMDPPGEAKSDFEIFKGIAGAWGCGDLLKEWSTPENVFKILQRTSRGRPCDITGIKGYRMLKERNGVQWPYPEGCEDTAVHRRLFEDGKFYTPGGKAKLLFEDFAPLPEEVDEEFDTVLLTGRGSVFQFHTLSRTGKVPFLRSKSPKENYVEVSNEDAARLGIADGAMVKVSSRRASVKVRAVVGNGVKPGQVYMPMHFMETNYLTPSVFDPYSKEPSYKYSAVKLEPASD